MAIKELKREWSPCQLGYVKHFLLHWERDVKDLPECCVGSIATVSETDNEYICTPDGWKHSSECAEGDSLTARVTALTEEMKGNGPHQMLVTGADGSTKWEDRTHWAGIERKTLVQQTVYPNEGGDFGDYAILNIDGETNPFKAGHTYKVVFDDTEYECMAWEHSNDINSVVGIGNGSIYLLEDKGGDEPFCILDEGDSITVCWGWDDSDHWISIEVDVENVKILDHKYFPEGYPYTEENNTVVVDTVSVETEDFGNGGFNNPETSPAGYEKMVEGERYRLTLDGEETEHVAKLASRAGVVFIGNPYAWGGKDNGTPYCVAVAIYITIEGTLNLWHTEAGTHTIKVEHMTETVHTLDPKYLPENDQRVGDDVYLTDSANVKWKLVVGTDGTLSAEAVTE